MEGLNEANDLVVLNTSGLRLIYFGLPMEDDKGEVIAEWPEPYHKILPKPAAHFANMIEVTIGRQKFTFTRKNVPSWQGTKNSRIVWTIPFNGYERLKKALEKYKPQNDRKSKSSADRTKLPQAEDDDLILFGDSTHYSMGRDVKRIMDGAETWPRLDYYIDLPDPEKFEHDTYEGAIAGEHFVFTRKQAQRGRSLMSPSIVWTIKAPRSQDLHRFMEAVASAANAPVEGKTIGVVPYQIPPEEERNLNDVSLRLLNKRLRLDSRSYGIEHLGFVDFHIPDPEKTKSPEFILKLGEDTFILKRKAYKNSTGWVYKHWLWELQDQDHAGFLAAVILHQKRMQEQAPQLDHIDKERDIVIFNGRRLEVLYYGHELDLPRRPPILISKPAPFNRILPMPSRYPENTIQHKIGEQSFTFFKKTFADRTFPMPKSNWTLDIKDYERFEQALETINPEDLEHLISSQGNEVRQTIERQGLEPMISELMDEPYLLRSLLFLIDQIDPEMADQIVQTSYEGFVGIDRDEDVGAYPLGDGKVEILADLKSIRTSAPSVTITGLVDRRNLTRIKVSGSRQMTIDVSPSATFTTRHR